MTRKKSPAKTKASAKTGGRYKGFIISFIALTLLLFLLIVYYSFSKTVIYIYPNREAVQESFRIIVKENIKEEDQKSNEYLGGAILEKEIEGTKTATDLGQAQEIPAQAEGRVTLHNNWSQVQPLAATTRLLSESGVLFRLKERVDVPAKGSIVAEVYADEEGVAGNIGPGKFTIPGLSSQMQELVYGQSAEGMSGGVKKVTVISQEIVNETQDSLISELKTQALDGLLKEARQKNEEFTLSEDRITYEILQKEASPGLGEEAEKLTINLKIKFIAITFSLNDLENLMKSHLEEGLDSGLRLASGDLTLNCEVENFNLEDKTATLKADASGYSEIRLSSPIFDRKNLTSKDRQQITAYFSDFDAIEKVEVKFSPFWVFKSPRLEDHIEIELK